MRPLRVILCAAAALATAGHEPAPPLRMSVHNRLLWNRAVVNGAPRIEVLVLTQPAAIDRLTTTIGKIDGRIGKRDARLGYLRVDLPTGRLLDLVGDPAVDAWQIASESRMSWYHDGRTVTSAAVYRSFETLAPPRSTPAHPLDRPVLTADAARAPGYTAEEDTGLAEWRRTHPTFDGRGVTIVNIEDGLLDFGHPALRSSLTLDGREVPKIAGIVNDIDRDSPDRTRVVLDTDVHVTRSWTRVGSRTFVFPRPGTYRFGIFTLGAGGNVVQQFGVVEDTTSGEVRVDANGDGDFRDDSPISDVNERYDVRELIIQPPPALRLPFVIGRGVHARTVHVYPALGSHVTMTASVTAGNWNADSLASGVAPNARLLLVRVGDGLRDYVEAYLAVGPREDVDVISDSNGLSLLPHTGDDFVGSFLTRFGETYNKIILHSANNTQLILNSASTPGTVLSIGGSMGPATFAALFGGKLDDVVVHPAGAAGPGIDGTIRPDVLAPMQVVAADLRSKDNGIGLPTTAPAARLPAGYQISCCTSASAPYAAGLTALLVSAAKQTRTAYSRDSLSRAIRFGARFLDAPAHQQGNGVFDINAAWRELSRSVRELDVRTTSAIVHPLAPYTAAGTRGSGLLEREGWHVGASRRRFMTFRRQSGPSMPTTYRVTWTGNDGTFIAPPSIALPLNTSVDVPIDVAPRTPGAHSALLNLHDRSNGDIVFRTQTTIVAAHALDERTHTAIVSGTIPTMGERSEYFRIPENASALTVKLRTTRGRVRVFLVPAHGEYPSYYWHQHPLMTPPLAPGPHVITLKRPLAGVWAVGLINDAARREKVASHDAVNFSLDVSTPGASLKAERRQNDIFDVDIRDVLRTIAEPALSTAIGTLTSARARLAKDGLPGLVDIDVPARTGMLMLRAYSENQRPMDAHLYDCTTGECFSHTFTMPARAEHSIAVRRPKSGRWVLAVNSAPSANASMNIVVDTILAGETQSVELPGSVGYGTVRRASLPVGTIPPAAAGTRRIILFELFDGAMAREELDFPWDSRPNVDRLADRPVAIATYLWSDER